MNRMSESSSSKRRTKQPVEIGCERGDHSMLDDLSTRVDATDGRLTRANKRLKEFVRKNEGELEGVFFL